MNYRILIFAILILVSNLVFATDPWNNPSPLAGSMTVMAQVSINGSPAVSGDVLAAFVSVGGTPELRERGSCRLSAEYRDASCKCSPIIAVK